MKKLLVIIAVITIIAAFAGCKKEVKPEGKKEATLQFDSFDGGGPKYKIKVKDKSIVKYTCEKQYKKANHEELDGAGFDIIYTFKGKKPGKTDIVVKGASPDNNNYRATYTAKVDKELNITIKLKRQ